jgi:hypothetical protein
VLAIFERERRRAPAVAARLAIALADLVLLRDVLDLRSSFFADARRAADASSDPDLRARARIVEAKVILEVGSPADAAALLTDAIAIAERARLEDVGAAAHRSLGWALLAAGHGEDARTALERALARHRVVADVRGQADALAARGLILALRGSIEEGHRDLESSHALHLLSGDVLRRNRVIEMAAMIGLDLNELDGASPEDIATRLRTSADAHRASGRLWREALDRLRLANLEGHAGDEQLALARKAAAGAGVSAAFTDLVVSFRTPYGREREEPRAVPWTVGPGARWLRDPAGSKRDLSRHGSLRRVIDALVTRRLAEPGTATPALTLFESGWPGERVRYESAMLRVYSSIRRLRALGLGNALITRDDGYLLDPEVEFERG